MIKYLIRIKKYTDERFPIIQSFIFANLLCISIIITSQIIMNNKTVLLFNCKILIGCITFFLVLFHLRLMDEFKDKKKDKIAYPDRMLSKGLISLNDLKILLFIIIILEIIINIFTSLQMFLIYLCIFIYSLLMYKDFFLKKLLKKSTRLYLISHQIIFYILFYYIIASTKEYNLKIFDNSKLFFLLIIMYCLLMTLFEIGRKTWSRDRENKMIDTYSKAWGVKNVSFVLIFLVIIIYLILSIIIVKSNFSFLMLLLIFSYTVFPIIIIIKYLLKPNYKNSKNVQKSTTFYIILLTLTFIITGLALKFYK